MMNVITSDADIQHDFDFAFLDLKANRYQEAENKFEQLVRRTNHYAAWSGMGIAKMGMILEDRATVAEVEYCFEKAKAYDVQNAKEVENLYAKSVLELIQAMYQLYLSNLSKSHSLNLNIALGLGTAFIGGLAAASEKSFTSRLMGVGLAGAATYKINKAFEDKKNLKQFNTYILNTAQSFYDSYKSFVTSNEEWILEMEQRCLEYKGKVDEVLFLEANPDIARQRKQEAKIENSKAKLSINFEGNLAETFLITKSVIDRIGYIKTVNESAFKIVAEFKDYTFTKSEGEIQVKTINDTLQQVEVVVKSDSKSHSQEEALRIINSLQNHNNPSFILNKTGKSLAFRIKFYLIVAIVLMVLLAMCAS